MSTNILFRGMLVSCFFILFSCASSNNSNSPEPQSPRTVNSNHEKSMIELFQQLSGVTVRGTGNDAVVRVNVGNFFQNTDEEPLYLLNGVAYADNFQSVQNAISPQDVKSVQVYKTAAELGVYGVRGVNGVINIKLKQSN